MFYPPSREVRLSLFSQQQSKKNPQNSVTETMSRQPSKRSLTLDLSSGGQTGSSGSAPKRTRLQVGGAGGSNPAPILTTPDVQMLKLSSPELAKFLTSGGSLATPTPSGGYLFPKTVTEEQELYAKGFEQALLDVRNKDRTTDPLPAATTSSSEPSARQMTASKEPSKAGSRPSSANSGSVESSEAAGGAAGSFSSLIPEGVVLVKQERDESQYDSDLESNNSSLGTGASGSLNPVDMQSQEKLKLERKRLRNRVAASKCRKKKLERISQLDERVAQLKGENSDLSAVVKKLKASVCSLKQEVIEHVNNGCQIVIATDM